ncbi:hypothetical protein BAXH7_02572 [Bacillus amyloliquefaciens XH7]|nr:hypothetical protein LL3_02649 [Bacillus amyloliquefaciens LL3]AEK89700.1 hypothetical protein BAXH7_02572 [Bacillus amyloliquefaciens XH7]KYC95605.1 hypothetical protein B425_2451 [Bacillus amyloliquefaciens]QBG56959.1 hypothetical protein D2M30_2630 [Bacillus amyloliquefaciens]
MKTRLTGRFGTNTIIVKHEAIVILNETKYFSFSRQFVKLILLKR